MKTKLNGEYALRHLFACLVMLCLGGWFAYDGFVVYPATPAAAIYEKIEGSPPREGMDVEAFKAQKIKTQYGFAFLCLGAFAVVALRLAAAARFSLEFDDEGFSFQGRRHSYGDVARIDDSRWEKKGVSRVVFKDGDSERALVLDAWHHSGIKEFHSKLAKG